MMAAIYQVVFLSANPQLLKAFIWLCLGAFYHGPHFHRHQGIYQTFAKDIVTSKNSQWAWKSMDI